MADRIVDMHAAGMAALTIVQGLAERLIDQRLLSKDEVLEVFDDAEKLHLETAKHTAGKQNADTAYLISQVRGDIAKR